MVNLPDDQAKTKSLLNLTLKIYTMAHTTSQSILVREFDTVEMYEISVQEWKDAEDKAGKSCAFAESRLVLNDGTVQDTGMTKEEYLEYRNQ